MEIKARLYFRFTRRMWNQFATMMDEHNWARQVRRTKTDADIPWPWVTYNEKPKKKWPHVRAEWKKAKSAKPLSMPAKKAGAGWMG